jgi:MASE9 protein
MALIEYVAIVILGGLVLAWEAWSPGQMGAEPLTLLFWVLANMLGELLWLPAPKQRGYLSMATAANFATLLILPVSLAVTVTVVAGALVDLMFRHRRWYQVLFNASVCCIAVFSAARVFTTVGQGRDGLENLLSPLNVGALFLSAVTYFLINTWLVTGVVSLDQRLKACHVWATTFASRQEVLGSFVLFVLGLLFAALFLAWGYMSAFLATIATYFVRQAYCRYIDSQPRPKATASPPGAVSNPG